MAVIPDDEILRRLRKLYKDAFHVHHEPSDAEVLRWADAPELWAEHEIRHLGKSFHMAEAVVRNCRSLRGRARRAAEAAAGSVLELTSELEDLLKLERAHDELPAAAGADPFDPLMPTCTTIPAQDEAA